MDTEFILLCKIGVGPVLVRYSDIILIESTPANFTRLDLSYGNHIIVNEDIFCVSKKIKDAKLLAEQTNNS